MQAYFEKACVLHPLPDILTMKGEDSALGSASITIKVIPSTIPTDFFQFQFMLFIADG